MILDVVKTKDGGLKSLGRYLISLTPSSYMILMINSLSKDFKGCLEAYKKSTTPRFKILYKAIDPYIVVSMGAHMLMKVFNIIDVISLEKINGKIRAKFISFLHVFFGKEKGDIILSFYKEIIDNIVKTASKYSVSSLKCLDNNIFEVIFERKG